MYIQRYVDIIHNISFALNPQPETHIKLVYTEMFVRCLVSVVLICLSVVYR